MTAESGFASRLRWWRRKRGLSQLQLALATTCSQRHLSFLELGRAMPSRAIVLRLSAALDLPLRQANELLLAAGYAPVWAETDLAEAALAPVRAALDHLLRQQEPFPAVVVDRRWNLLQANCGAAAMVTFLIGPIARGTPMNLADALVAPDLLRPHLENWPEVVRYFVRGVEADSLEDGTPQTLALLNRLLGYPDVRETMLLDAPAEGGAPVLPIHIRKADVRLRLFTAITTLGTPRDITLQELRIESFFPMDDDTRSVFRAWSTRPST